MKKYLLLCLTFLSLYNSYGQSSSKQIILSRFNYQVKFNLQKPWNLDTIHLPDNKVIAILYNEELYPNKEVMIRIEIIHRDTNSNSLEENTVFYKTDEHIRQLQKNDSIHEKYTYQKMMVTDKAVTTFSYMIDSGIPSTNLYAISLISKKVNSAEDLNAFLNIVVSFTLDR